MMRKYNKMDVVQTEKLFDILRPWINGLPNPALYNEFTGRYEQTCERCGGHEFQKRGFAYTQDRRYYRNGVTATVAVYAPDPLLYEAQQSVVVPMFQEGGGFTFPYTFPYVFGGGGPIGDTVATNGGDQPAPPHITIYGYAERPYVENVGTGEVLSLSLNLGATDSVVIDCAEPHSVILNGVTSVRGAVDPTSSFFSLQPGSTHLRLRARGISSGHALVAWQSAQI